MSHSGKNYPHKSGAGAGAVAQDALADLFSQAVDSGTLSTQTSTLLTGDLGQVVIAGAAGVDAETIVSSDVTLITLLIDASSSIGYRRLEKAVRDGYGLLLDALGESRERDSVLVALWLFNHTQKVVHSYVPIIDATRLDGRTYRTSGATCLYDTWCDALLANVAYAEKLRATGTPCRSVVVVLTDGEDTSSTRDAKACQALSRDLLASEQFVLAFVGVGDEADFRQVARAMGVPEGSIEVQRDATPHALRQAFQLVSQSAIRASQGQLGATSFFA
ncbi:MAG: VWA domain-containing protein [Deltaproteobacteria bacterium]|nr:VWA domain-containing protein [Deltaproteobacteria bacterium]